MQLSPTAESPTYDMANLKIKQKLQESLNYVKRVRRERMLKNDNFHCKLLDIKKSAILKNSDLKWIAKSRIRTYNPFAWSRNLFGVKKHTIFRENDASKGGEAKDAITKISPDPISNYAIGRDDDPSNAVNSDNYNASTGSARVPVESDGVQSNEIGNNVDCVNDAMAKGELGIIKEPDVYSSEHEEDEEKTILVLCEDLINLIRDPRNDISSKDEHETLKLIEVLEKLINTFDAYPGRTKIREECRNVEGWSIIIKNFITAKLIHASISSATAYFLYDRYCTGTLRNTIFGIIVGTIYNFASLYSAIH